MQRERIWKPFFLMMIPLFLSYCGSDSPTSPAQTATMPVETALEKFVKSMAEMNREADVQEAYDALTAAQRKAVRTLAKKTASEFKGTDKDTYDGFDGNQEKYFKSITKLIGTPTIKTTCKGNKNADGSYRELTDDERALLNAAKNDGVTLAEVEALLGDPKKICPNIQETSGQREGFTPLHWFGFHSDDKDTDILPDVIEAIIEAGADLNIQSNAGETPLHFATERGYVEMMKAFIKGGANVNIQDYAGDTPLHDAAWDGDEDTVEVLLKAGAKKTITNNEKKTAEQVARDEGTPDLGDFIKCYGRKDEECR